MVADWLGKSPFGLCSCYSRKPWRQQGLRASIQTAMFRGWCPLDIVWRERKHGRASLFARAGEIGNENWERDCVQVFSYFFFVFGPGKRWVKRQIAYSVLRSAEEKSVPNNVPNKTRKFPRKADLFQNRIPSAYSGITLIFNRNALGEGNFREIFCKNEKQVG